MEMGTLCVVSLNTKFSDSGQQTSSVLISKKQLHSHRNIVKGMASANPFTADRPLQTNIPIYCRKVMKSVDHSSRISGRVLTRIL
ncbi:hypothetical protein D918_01842 [Trichuris suis]|nr:hypothetical protein D918_01842 [Trichuris suis]